MSVNLFLRFHHHHGVLLECVHSPLDLDQYELTHLGDKVALQTHFSGVHPSLGARHLLPLLAAARGLNGAVQVLEQLTATRPVVLVQGDAGPDQLFPCEVVHGQEQRVGLAVKSLRDHREEHGAGQVERDGEVWEPAPHNHLFGVAAEAADAREEVGLIIHFGQKQRFVGAAGPAGLRGQGDSLFGPGGLHLQRHLVPHQSRVENFGCVISLFFGGIVKVNG